VQKKVYEGKKYFSGCLRKYHLLILRIRSYDRRDGSLKSLYFN